MCGQPLVELGKLANAHVTEVIRDLLAGWRHATPSHQAQDEANQKADHGCNEETFDRFLRLAVRWLGLSFSHDDMGGIYHVAEFT